MSYYSIYDLKEAEMKSHHVSWKSFIYDVFICSLGAYGGPASHYGIFTEQLVERKHYIDEEDLVELIALCSILPGPTSTQTIVSIGYKVGGPLLALFTMLTWTLPVLIVMTGLSFLYQALDTLNLSYKSLQFIGPMSVGFIIIAAQRIGKKVATDKMTLSLLVFSAVTTYFFRSPWIFPLVLITGGVVSVVLSKEKNLWNHVKLDPPWIFFISFAALAVGSLLAKLTWDHSLINIFESFYRYGYLVFGGGQVVVPVMHTELVQVKELMTNQEFLTGYGLVQGLPGPMFSFSAYAGGLSARGQSALFQVLGSVAGGVGIFLPGLLLIYFVFPIWENMKKIKGIKVSLKGINAVAGGLISVSAIILMQKSGFTPINLGITALTALLLWSKKLPAPLIVILTILLGILI